MIHTAVTSTADGSVVIPVDMNVSDAEKKLAKLKGSIEKTEKKISDMTKEKEKAEQKGLFQGAEIEAEHRKLQEIKDRLEDIRKLSKDKTISFDRREDYAAQIPIVKQDLADQQTRVRALEAEWKKTENAVDSYNLKIASANEELTAQKIAAGELVQQIEEAENASRGMGGLMDRAGEKFSSVLKKLLSAGAGLAKSAITKIPTLLKNAFSGATKIVGAFGKKLIDVTKNMNVFSKLSAGLSQKFKQLGQMIKRVFVFSVITSGLRAIRTQMSGYLQVNTEFMTALRRLQGVLLTAFQPIYDAVLPALTALINGMSQAVALVSQFTARLFGTTAKQSQKSAEALYNEAKALEATGSAADDAAGSLAGFDEINSIQTENKSSGGGAAAESGPLFDYEYEDQPFDSWGEALNGFLDKLLSGIPQMRETLLDFADWLNGFTQKLYDMFTFPGVLDKVKQLGQDLASVLNDAVNQINWYQLGQALGAGMNLALQFLTNFIYTFDWINLGMSLAAMVNGAVSEIDWYAVGQLLWAGFKIAIETLAGFLLGLDMVALAEAASSIVIGFFTEIKNTLNIIPWSEIGSQIALFLASLNWSGMFQSVYDAFGAALDALANFIVGFLDEIGEQLDMHGITDPLIELVQTVHDFIQTIVEDTVNWANALDLAPLSQAVQSLYTAISQLVSTVSDGLLWAYENVLLPLATWFIEEGAPASVEALSDAFNLITEILEPLIDIFKLLWEQVIQPFVEWVEGTAVTVIEGLGSVFEKVADIFQTKGEQIQNIISFVMEIIAAMWEQSQPILEGMQDLVGNVFEFIGDIISTVVSSAIDILSGLIDFIEGVFSGDWEKAWDGISSVFKGIWNGIVALLEGAVNLIVKGINTLISGLNKLHIDIPDNPFTGAMSLGFNIPSIPEAKIPRLAQGAVIPPNREFMAVLGDQKSGNNLEAPEDLIRKIMREESGGGNAELVQLLQSILSAIKAGHVIMVGETVFGRTTIKAINNVNTAAGKQLLLI